MLTAGKLLCASGDDDDDGLLMSHPLKRLLFIHSF